MKRKWNWPLWVGFVVAVGGLFTYEFLAEFPMTRDFPWVNLLLFGIGATLLLIGLFRAFGRPQLYRGKVFGSIFLAIAVWLIPKLWRAIKAVAARLASFVKPALGSSNNSQPRTAGSDTD